MLTLLPTLVPFALPSNKFSGTDSDSNILKIYRMLDRSNGLDAHYYQPGIGTYVNTHNLSHTSLTTRLISWYKKAKDSAVGTSFDSHVMGGYKFLMKCYQDDDIFIFGFSRGAYVARFLAEMLDHVGLLSNGNEEMAYFAWKAFSQWQEREEGSDEDKKKKEEMYQHLKAFRETFSRPVRRIRFLGLFDTVNSVPRFENAWMQRSKFPYTARSSAKIIRHAVSIDERYSLLKWLTHPSANGIEGEQNSEATWYQTPKRPTRSTATNDITITTNPTQRRIETVRREDGMDMSAPSHHNPTDLEGAASTQNDSQLHARPTTSEKQQMRSLSPGRGQDHDDLQSLHSRCSLLSLTPREDEYELDEAANQDIEELWFPGCHADLGGGWPLDDLNECALSHPPLVWMIREAQRAGLELDDEQMLNLHCRDEDPRMLDATFPSMNPAHQQQEWEQQAQQQQQQIPTFQVTTPSQPNIFRSPHSEHAQPGWHAGLEPEAPKPSEFHRRLHHAATRSTLHDCLKFNNGLPRASVLSWKIMEYLPFRRMDLQPDGSWKAITLPLPMGEVRDIPEDAKIHHSAIRRMEADENYRPGNLIVGGGGRGVRKAPAELGIGEWMVHNNKGDPVGEVVVRKVKSLNKEMKEEGK
ncbi:MAG: hypothetical protein LQ344_000994 [Seirophora lacunosa]|nr:MAG: hypothetical protein LQ344_000994 [Seirophora lacunosa]